MTLVMVNDMPSLMYLCMFENPQLISLTSHRHFLVSRGPLLIHPHASFPRFVQRHKTVTHDRRPRIYHLDICGGCVQEGGRNRPRELVADSK